MENGSLNRSSEEMAQICEVARMIFVGLAPKSNMSKMDTIKQAFDLAIKFEDFCGAMMSAVKNQELQAKQPDASGVETPQ